MSFQGPAWKAVQALFADDTGSGGLNNASSPLVTGMKLERAYQQTARPYIVYSVRGDQEMDSFGGNQAMLDFTFGIYTDADSASPADSYAIMERLRTVYHKIETTVTISAVNYRVRLWRTGGVPIPEAESVYHHEEFYRAFVAVVT